MPAGVRYLPTDSFIHTLSGTIIGTFNQSRVQDCGSISKGCTSVA